MCSLCIMIFIFFFIFTIHGKDKRQALIIHDITFDDITNLKLQHCIQI